MALSSGYSIQRTEIIDVPHRQHVETHTAVGTNTIYVLKSKPDFSDKEWLWEIKIGEVRIALNRAAGTNRLATSSMTPAEESTHWQSDTYTEGSLDAGLGVIKYITNVGEFGALEFLPQTAPISGEIVEVRYQESQDQWTGSDGGLLYQLAKDLTTHPYEMPEVFRNNMDTVKYVGSDNHTLVSLTSYSTTEAHAAFTLDNRFTSTADYSGTDLLESARTGKKIWKSAKEFSFIYENQSFTPAAGGAEADLVIDFFPLTANDLGDGEFRISVEGKVIPRSSWTAVSNSNNRSTKFTISKNDAITWSWVLDRSAVDVEISYMWKHSLEVPYGALLGKSGLGPTQESLNSADYSVNTLDRSDISSPATVFTQSSTSGKIVRHQGPLSLGSGVANPFGDVHNTGYIMFDIEGTDATAEDWYTYNKYMDASVKDKRSQTVTSGASVSLWLNKGETVSIGGGAAETVTPAYGNVTLTASASGVLDIVGGSSTALMNFTKMAHGDAFMLTYEDNPKFAAGFNLIYPTPVSNSPAAVKNALKEITTSFLVESSTGTDLLSDETLVPEYYQVQSQRRPQKWRLRFEWNRKLQSIKVNVATEYQLLDNMTVTSGQERDGIKSPIYREPGELCDVYMEPNTGRTLGYEMVKAKSNWFRRAGRTEDNLSRTYPMSYRITVTDHGMGLFVWDQASVDQDDDYAWFVVQRHVDQTTGQPEYSNKSPVHCLYSPSKRPVDIADLNQFYASADVNDLTKSENVFTSLGQMLETEGPTMYLSAAGATPVFNGVVNALDFTGYGYTAGLLTAANIGDGNSTFVKNELDRGIIGGNSSDTTGFWNKATYETTPTTLPDKLRAATLIDFTTDFLADGSTPLIDEHSTAVSADANFQSLTYKLGNFNLLGVNVGDRYILVTYKDILSAAGTTVNLIAGEDYTLDRPNNTITLLGGFSDASGSTSASYTAGRITDQRHTSTNTELKVYVAADLVKPNLGKVNDLQILGFQQLPRDGNNFTPASGSARSNSDARANTAGWLTDTTLSPHFSGNVVFPSNRIERVSTFAEAAVSAAGITNSVTGAELGEWKDPSFALLDILYNENPANREKVLDSLIVALDGQEIERDADGYILQYDEWTRSGDPTTVGRFIQSLDAAGVNELGTYFKIPATEQLRETVNRGVFDAATANYVKDDIVTHSGSSYIALKSLGAGVTPSVGDNWALYTGIIVDGLIIPNEIVNIVLGVGNRHLFNPEDGTGATSTYINETTGITYTTALSVALYDMFFKFVDPSNTNRSQARNTNLGWIAGKYRDEATGNEVLPGSTGHTVLALVKSTISTSSKLIGRMAGDPVFFTTGKQKYIYDFFNQTLMFSNPPRNSAELIVKLINYVYSDPARASYYIVSPPDRDFPERNQNKQKTINRFCVREQDVLKPWDYHVSATMHEVDSHAIINPQEQLSITQERDFVFSFPTQLTSQRFYYPRSELDLICISSADFSTQSGSIEIDKYSDSNGLRGTALVIDGVTIDPSPSDNSDEHDWGGHIGPSGDVLYWKRNKRKYEGMMSTLPNGNGMRVFLQVSGSSIKYTDVVEGASPA